MDDDVTYHLEGGRVRLPYEIVEKWDECGYGLVDKTGLYSVLFWLADLGYSIIPDKQYDDFMKAKENNDH